MKGGDNEMKKKNVKIIMNVDKKYCIEITIFIYNYIMVEIIPLKIQSENLKVKNNVRIFLSDQILPYHIIHR